MQAPKSMLPGRILFLFWIFDLSFFSSGDNVVVVVVVLVAFQKKSSCNSSYNIFFCECCCAHYKACLYVKVFLLFARSLLDRVSSAGCFFFFRGECCVENGE